MFARIIVGIDGYDGGRDARALADRLAAPDTELVLVNAYPYQPPNRGSLGSYEQLLREDAEKKLREGTGDDRRYRVEAVPDTSPGRALHEQAERERADLIVIGSCHRAAVGRVLLGDVSRTTLHGAPCPVAVVPHGYRDQAAGPIHTIGVGLNATDESNAALAFAARLAHAVRGKLRILTAVAPPAATATAYAHTFDWTAIQAADRLGAEQLLAQAAAALEVPAETETIDASPGVALEHLSEHVEVIVAGSRGWGATHRVLLGSTTDRLTHHAHCPVIVVPSPVAGSERSRADQHRGSATRTIEPVQP